MPKHANLAAEHDTRAGQEHRPVALPLVTSDAMISRDFTNVFRILPWGAQRIAQTLIGAYRLVLSPLVGLDCRHLPTCSAYAEEAIGRFGLWSGGWMTLARLCRCHPFGTRGLDFVPHSLPHNARWYFPWRYGRWRGTNCEPSCDP
jgi:putative membrane protein insertion efficiency factor